MESVRSWMTKESYSHSICSCPRTFGPLSLIQRRIAPSVDGVGLPEPLRILRAKLRLKRAYELIYWGCEMRVTCFRNRLRTSQTMAW